MMPAGSGTEGGLAPRREAIRLLYRVLRRRQPLDDLLRDSLARGPLARLPERDRALVRAIVGAALRHKGQLDDVLDRFLERPLPAKAGPVREILLASAAQILFLRVPTHAASDLAVRLAGEDVKTERYKGLVNALLRRVVHNGPMILEAQDRSSLNTPGWLLERWRRVYGPGTAAAIAEAHRDEAALDLTPRWPVRAEELAMRLGATVLPTGTLRIAGHSGRIEELAGFHEGAWWVQDAAAALPVRLLGDIGGQAIFDLCAAPGGKTLQLAARGARVTAVDLSARRLERLADNLQRTGLKAEVVCSDALAFAPSAAADAVVLDVPCSATGTIRRHPDIPWIKTPEQIATLSDLQQRLLAHAVTMVRSGGYLIYCCCSLEPEEGAELVEGALANGLPAQRVPVQPEEIGNLNHLLTSEGDVRTLPFHAVEKTGSISGLDGFFVCRLRRM